MGLTCVRVSPGGKICGGEIEDGICGACGKPQFVGRSAPTVTTSLPVTLRGATCIRVLADGAICGGPIEDGVCATCGRLQIRAIASAKADPIRAILSRHSEEPKVTAPPFPPAAIEPTRAPPPSPLIATRRGARRSNARANNQRQSLGAGLVSLPPAPRLEPEKLVLATPEVPLSKRRCGKCDAQVYRMNGFCGHCATPFDFRPALKVGDMLAKKYEIMGPIAFGGMGWIYLGRDTILGRWIVIKGLLNTADEEAAAAAVAERRFLAAVRHGNIVAIYDFVAQGSQGFIVMEFVAGRAIEAVREARDLVDVVDPGGQTLRCGVRRDTLSPAEQRLLIHVDEYGVLAPEEAISYILAILPAFRYLHAQGFVYCDFKADNLLLEVDDVKLVDLGAVRRIGDQDGAIFGTDGFCSKDGMESPSVLSDIYSIGRTLAYLLMDFLYKSKLEEDKTTGQFSVRRMMVKRFVDTLPSPQERAVLAQNDSLYRFLLRATHENPDQRFQSVDEMETQLHGVLREISARSSGPKPAESRIFGADKLVDVADRAGASAPLARLLPNLRLAADDDAASDILALASVIDPTKRIEAMATVIARNKHSIEAKLRYADALIDAEMYPESLSVSENLLLQDEFEWRAQWYAGKALLADGKPSDALARFDRVYFELPGELAPKLALAFANEAAGRLDPAIDYYRRIVSVDPAMTSACFGLARCMRSQGDTAGALWALNAVPPSHSLYSESRLTLARLALEADNRLDKQLLQLAADSLAAVTTDSGVKHQIAGALFEVAAGLVVTGAFGDDGGKDFMGSQLTPIALREAAEREYRRAARVAGSIGERQMWVDTANRVRPRTLF